MHAPLSLRALGLLALAIVVTGWGTLAFGQIGGGGGGGAGGPCTTIPTPIFDTIPAQFAVRTPGMPKPWEPSRQVTPFTTLNLRSGGVITTIPGLGWDPGGPPVVFNFYHNGPANPVATGGGVNSSLPPCTPWTQPGPNKLIIGQGWRTSYSSTVSHTSGSNIAIVTEDDGTLHTFIQSTTNPDVFMPPPGVHDRLIRSITGEGLQWELRRASQDSRLFNSSGELIFELDSYGHFVTIVRASATEWYIRSAAHALLAIPSRRNQLKVEFDNDGRMIRVTEDFDAFIFPQSVNLTRDDCGHIIRFDPNYYTSFQTKQAVKIEYTDSLGQAISKISTHDLLQWELDYDQTGETPTFDLLSVTERSLESNGTPSELGYTETFSYRHSNAAVVANNAASAAESWYTSLVSAGCGEPFAWTQVVDRRGHSWWYGCGPSTLRRLLVPGVSGADPSGSWSWNPQMWSFVWDAARNLIATTDPLLRVNSATYDAWGNVLTSTSQVAGQTTTYQWETAAGQPLLDTLSNFARLKSVTDPLQRTTTLTYGVPSLPLNPTHVLVANTRPVSFEYETSSTSLSRGELKKVIDANLITTSYDYDAYGYRIKTEENGLVGAATTIVPMPVTQGGERDSKGRWQDAYNSFNPAPLGPASFAYDEFGNIRSSKCGGVGGSLGETWSGETGSYPECVTSNVPRRVGWFLSRLPADERADLEPGCGGRVEFSDAQNRPELLKACTPRRSSVFTFGGIDTDTSISYGPFNRVNTLKTSRTHITEVQREIKFQEYDADGRPLRITDHGTPATGQTEFSFVYDQLGRPRAMFRGAIGIWLRYDKVGQHTRTFYSNGVVEQRAYLPDGRLQSIQTNSATTAPLVYTSYTWNLDNTVATRTEIDMPGETWGVTTFLYDDLGQLTRETRIGDQSYDYQYTYDLTGNRLTKLDHGNLKKTEYYYDYMIGCDFIGSPCDGSFQNGGSPSVLDRPARGNRLVKYDERSFTQAPGGPIVPGPITRTVIYTYYQSGDPSNLIVKDAADPWYRAINFTFTSQNQLWVAVWERWKYDEGGAVIDRTFEKAHEFMYDADGRRRWLSRPLERKVIGCDFDPEGVPARTQVVYEPKRIQTGPTQWTEEDLYTEYLGTTPLNDIKVTRTFANADDPPGAGSTPSNTIDTRYTGTMVASQSNQSTTYHRYHHGDMVGSTVQLSDNTGGPAIPKFNQAYSAFGERIGAHSAAGGGAMMDTRYQYKGAWGYESGLLIREGAPGTEPIELTHVGARWYDAKVGRFIQRDPIGIMGGLNVYVYCRNNPITYVDATGKVPTSVVGAAIGAVTGGIVDGLTAWSNGESVVDAVIAGAAGGAVSGALMGLGGASWLAGAGLGVSGGTLGSLTKSAVKALLAKLRGRKFDSSNVLTDALLDGLAGGGLGCIGGLADEAGEPVAKWLVPAVYNIWRWTIDRVRGLF